MKHAIMALTLLLATISLQSCGVDVPASSSDLDITLTGRDPAYNFASIRTYALPETVQVVQDPNNPGSNTTIDTSMSSFIIGQVESQLNALGYQRLTDTSGPKPDVFVQISAMSTTNTTVYYSGWDTYWGAYYGPWYGTGAYAGYAPYPSSYVVTSTIGSLIINMTNPNQANSSTKQIPSVWVAVLNGLLYATGTADTQTRIQNGINEAFSQSPYLKGAS